MADAVEEPATEEPKPTAEVADEPVQEPTPDTGGDSPENEVPVPAADGEAEENKNEDGPPEPVTEENEDNPVEKTVPPETAEDKPVVDSEEAPADPAAEEEDSTKIYVKDTEKEDVVAESSANEKPDDEQPDETLPEAEPKLEDGEPPLPQSEDFTAGEKPEEDLTVAAEVLSREGTPVEPVSILEENDMVRPGTPEKEADEKNVIFEEEEEEEEEMPKYTREEYVERYHAALQEREMLNQKNHALQHKLAEYFRRKKTEESRQEVDRNVTDQEQRYMKYMSNLEDLRLQESSEKKCYNEDIEEMKQRKADKQASVEEEWNQYCQFKRSVALSSVNSRSGRPLTMKEFEIYEINEVKKEGEVSQVRLENIKLRNRLRKREMQLKQKEELAEGLHLIDFEQLKIENQTYNEKIEERNEELMKLRKKIKDTVQVLTHLKEKLQFVQGENLVARQELVHVESEVARKRDILSRTKQARDALRHDNSKLRQKCGLLGNPLLLRDYEEGTDELTDLSHKLDQLKRTHAELTLSISGVKKKIEQAKAQAQN